MSLVLDNNGKVKYSITTSGGIKTIKDPSGRVLGFIKNGKTYDAAGRIVSHGEDVSAILN